MLQDIQDRYARLLFFNEEVSNREIKMILSYKALMELLKEKGYNIARRTVAKYREQLNIPVARLRKEL